MLDLNLLRVATNKKDCARLATVLPRDALEDDTRLIFEAMERYFATYKKHKKIDWPTFLSFFYSRVGPNATEDEQAIYNGTFKNAMKPAPEGVREVLLDDVMTLRLVTQAARISERYSAGEDIDAALALKTAVDAFRLGTANKGDAHNQTPIEDLLDRTLSIGGGLKWRLPCLDASMKPLVGGHFGIVAARPDAGKTSFIASEATFFAPQIQDDRPVLWFSNEGSSNEIIPRIWQAATNCTIHELMDLREKGNLREEYSKAVGGSERIRVYDVHGWNIGQLEVIIENEKPGLVIFDMLDNVYSSFGGETRVDQRLEHLYQRVRELCVIHDFVGIATSQVSAEGDGELFPKLSAMKESKTGKQGACDWAIMIGMSNDRGMANIRGISCPKNKLVMPGAPKDPHKEVRFDYLRARYDDLSTDDATLLASMEAAS